MSTNNHNNGFVPHDVRNGREVLVTDDRTGDVYAGSWVESLIDEGADDLTFGTFDDPIRGPDEPARVPYEMLFRHAFLSGSSGMGKSVAAGRRLHHAIRHGFGVGLIGGKSVDIDNVLRTLPADRVDDVVYIALNNDEPEGDLTVGFNILQVKAHPDTPEFEREVTEIVNLVFDFVNSNGVMSGRAESGFRALLKLFVTAEAPYTLVDVCHALSEDDGIESVLDAESAHVTNFERECIEEWTADETLIQPVLRRLMMFCESQLYRNLLSSPDGLPFSLITEGQKLLFVSLQDVEGQNTKGAIATLLSNALWRSRYAYGGTQKPFMLCLDELDVFDTGGLMLEEMLSQGRSLEFAVTLSVQMVGNLSENTRKSLANIDSFYAFSPGPNKSEAGRISQALGVNGTRLMQLNPYHCFTRLYRNDGSQTDPLEVSLFAPPVPVRSELDVDKLKMLSRQKYGVQYNTDVDQHRN